MRRLPPMRWSIFAAVVGALLGAAALFALRPDPVGHRGQDYAAAIVRGMQEGLPPPPDAAEDETLSHDANDAGYRWAERHSVTDPAQCAVWQRAFRAGCEAYVQDQVPTAASTHR